MGNILIEAATMGTLSTRELISPINIITKVVFPRVSSNHFASSGKILLCSNVATANKIPMKKDNGTHIYLR